MKISIPSIKSSNVRRLWLPLVVSLVLFAVCVAILAIPGAWMYPTILYAENPRVTIIAVVLSLGTVVFVCWRYHWASGVIALTGIICVAASVALPIPAESIARRAADVVEVIRCHSFVQDKIRELKKNGVSPAVVVVPIDGFGSMTSGIVYDPTGEILLAPASRSKSWMATAGRTELGLDGLEVRHIIGNYYSWFHY